MKLKLRAKRVEKGFTQESFAKEIGVSTATYNRYEKGYTEMTESIISRVLMVLQCKYEDIFEF
jgi:DNA-binding XRE family transcriptional regulator